MKKQLIFCVKFLVLLIAILYVIDFTITAGLKNNQKGYYGKMRKICKNENLPRVAIFSSSVGEMGFDCKVLEKETNKSWYNFSLSGTTFKQYVGLIHEVNKPDNNIGTVVLGEVIFTFQDNPAINELERYLPYIDNDNVYKSLYSVQPDLAFKSRHIPFYKYIATSKEYYYNSLQGLKSLVFRKKNTDSLLGQIRVNRTWEKDQDSILSQLTHMDIVIDTNILRQYKETVQQLVANNKKVIITIPPFYLPSWQRVIDMTEFRNTLKSMADNKNVFYWDFSVSMVDKQNFYNVLHLNTSGAAKFSKMFADSVMKYNL